jgi:hypothetical protein
MNKKITLTELRNIISEVLNENSNVTILNDYVKAVEKRLDKQNIFYQKKGQNIVVYKKSNDPKSKSFIILFSIFEKGDVKKVKMSIEGQDFFNIDSVFKKLEDIKKEYNIEFKEKKS